MSDGSLWETHAAWWIEGFTDGADPEYEEQILPLAAARARRARRRVLDVGCGDGQISRLAAELGRRGHRHRPDVELCQRRRTSAAARRSPEASAAALPFADASFDAVVACLVFEHIRDVDEAIAEVARVLQPGGRFCFFLNHPLLQTPNSGWIDDQCLDPPEQYWRIGAVPRRGGDDRGGREGRVHPVHPPPAQPLRQRPRRERAADRADGGAGAARRVPRACQRVPRRGDDPAAAVSPNAQAVGNTIVVEWPTSC